MIMHKGANSSQRVVVAVRLIKLQSQFLSWYVVKKNVSPRVRAYLKIVHTSAIRLVFSNDL